MHQGNSLYVLIPLNLKSYHLNLDLQNNLFEVGAPADFQELCVVFSQTSTLSTQFNIVSKKILIDDQSHLTEIFLLF